MKQKEGPKVLDIVELNNMDKEEFLKLIRKRAKEYAHYIVVEAEEHQDAVYTIIYDYTSGALEAYRLLTSKNE